MFPLSRSSTSRIHFDRAESNPGNKGWTSFFFSLSLSLSFCLYSSTRHLVNFTKDEEGNEFPRDSRARKWGVRWFLSGGGFTLAGREFGGNFWKREGGDEEIGLSWNFHRWWRSSILRSIIRGGIIWNSFLFFFFGKLSMTVEIFFSFFYLVEVIILGWKGLKI